MLDDLNDTVNSVRYSRILFLIGQFNQALLELINQDFLVEAALFGLIMQHLGIIPSRQELTKLITTTSEFVRFDLKKEFTEDKLVAMFNQSVSLDSCFVTLAF